MFVYQHVLGDVNAQMIGNAIHALIPIWIYSFHAEFANKVSPMTKIRNNVLHIVPLDASVKNLVCVQGVKILTSNSRRNVLPVGQGTNIRRKQRLVKCIAQRNANVREKMEVCVLAAKIPTGNSNQIVRSVRWVTNSRRIS